MILERYFEEIKGEADIEREKVENGAKVKAQEDDIEREPVSWLREESQ